MMALALSGTSMLVNNILIALLLMPSSLLWCEGNRMVKPEGLHLFLEFSWVSEPSLSNLIRNLVCDGPVFALL